MTPYAISDFIKNNWIFRRALFAFLATLAALSIFFGGVTVVCSLYAHTFDWMALGGTLVVTPIGIYKLATRRRMNNGLTAYEQHPYTP